jgi:hypothetical protein
MHAVVQNELATATVTVTARRCPSWEPKCDRNLKCLGQVAQVEWDNEPSSAYERAKRAWVSLEGVRVFVLKDEEPMMVCLLMGMTISTD